MEKEKEVFIECKTCLEVKNENEKLKDKISKLDKVENSNNSLKKIISVWLVREHESKQGTPTFVSTVGVVPFGFNVHQKINRHNYGCVWERAYWGL